MKPRECVFCYNVFNRERGSEREVTILISFYDYVIRKNPMILENTVKEIYIKEGGVMFDMKKLEVFFKAEHIEGFE